MFCRYVLRTLDVDAARAFYGEVVGIDFSEAPERSGVESFPLHEQARARGAVPHWLGMLATSDVERTAARLVELGSMRLGPTQTGGDGASFAVLRDPCEAIVGVREPTAPPVRETVAWHHLNTADLERSWAIYTELVGWHTTETLEVLGAAGGIRTFAWDRSGRSAGSAASIARRPEVHPHWLFFFRVADLDAALASVAAKGGKSLAPFTLPNGARLAACDDPQGAAFGLLSGG